MEEDEEGDAAALADVTMAEALQDLDENGAPRAGEDRHQWASRLLASPAWPEEAAQMRQAREDSDLMHCEQWYGETRDQHYNADTERLLQVAHAPPHSGINVAYAV